MIIVLIKEAMTKNVITVDRKATVFDACNIYKEKKVGCLIVTEEERCVGIVTERDLIERTICAGKDPKNTLVEEIMTSDIITVHALDKIENAIELIELWKVKKIPVVKNEDIVGIITVTDITKARPDLSERFINSWIKARWKD